MIACSWSYDLFENTEPTTILNIIKAVDLLCISNMILFDLQFGQGHILKEIWYIRPFGVLSVFKTR